MQVSFERQARRHAVTTDCMVLSDRTGDLLARRSLDLSTHGALVRCEQGASLGEQVSIMLRIPRSGIWVRAAGTVTRVLPGRRRTDRGPSAAIKVTRMDGMSRLLLGHVLSSYPPPPPSRGFRKDYAARVARIAQETTD